MTVRSRGLVSLLAVSLAATGMLVGGPPGSLPHGAAAATVEVVTPPNIVVVMSDDQRRHAFATMPTVRKELIHGGTSYIGFSPTSACCPSRTSFLTANYSHTTGVYNNVDPIYGGWPAFNASGWEDTTIATELDASGYHTGLVGKYLNLWNKAPQDFVPPGWDVFRAIYSDVGQGGGRYYDYELRGTQPTEYFGDSAADYSTDVLADRAVRFVRNAPEDQPFFLLFTPYGPHEPSTPAPRDKGTWAPKYPYDNPAINEKDMSDKPEFMQDLPRVDRAWIKRAKDRSGEALMSVDDAVARLIKEVGDQMPNTLFVYTSDQGVMWGEHRMREKYNPYQWATEYPLIMRWGNRLPVEQRDRLVPNVDFGATLLDVAGVTPSFPIAGSSVFDSFRADVVLEGLAVQGRPAYCGLRMRNWLYVEWSDDLGVELYDYGHDPNELENVAGRPGFAEKEAEMRQRTVELCSPTPPGFTW